MSDAELFELCRRAGEGAPALDAPRRGSGVRHNPVADDEVGIVLIETVTTAHTGEVVVDGTVPIEAQRAVD
jgi:hypothetical protein